MSELWRLFIALELPPEIVRGLSEIQARLKAQTPPHAVKWVDPAGIHLTLKFLGDVPAARCDTLQAALTEAVQSHHAFDLAAGGIGCFPNTQRPRVVWVGVHGGLASLAALRDSVERVIAPLGYPTEARPFNPHLTVGRVRQEAPRHDVTQVGHIVEHAGESARHTWTVRGVSLMRSELRPSGAVYTQLFYVPLM